MKSINYFLFIINEKNWEIVKASNTIGTEKKDTFDKLRINDRILVYVSGISKIMGLYQVLSKYEDDTPLFSDKVYTYKIKLNLLEFFDKELNLGDIAHKLEFIKNKEKWYSTIGGLKGSGQISLRDYTALIKSLV